MRELVRVAEENQRMQRRLQTVQPRYNREQWEREWQTNLQLIDHMSAFTPDWWKHQDQVSGAGFVRGLRGLTPSPGNMADPH